MKTYALFASVLLLSMARLAVAQTAPTPGLGCAPAAHIFCVTTTAESGTGSLRQAITDSNTAGGANTIGFQIPGSGPQTITLTSQLPAINANNNLASLTIDGYSQPGSVPNTNAPDQGGLNTTLMIEITGTGGFYGFFFNCCAAPSITITLQGLDLHGFLAAILGQNYGNGKIDYWNIYGCFIGTNIDGTAAASLAGGGLNIGYDSAQIGGTSAWQRNLISGTNYSGVSAGFPGETVVIEGNLIGTDASGTQSIPNATGISLGDGNSAGLRVGCTGAGCTAAGHPSRNVISGNRGMGMNVGGSNYGGPGGQQIKGNFIGTDWSGAMPLPNGRNGCPANCAGIWVQIGGTPATPASIGGFNAGEANVIAYNNGPGIASPDARVSESFDNRGNAIHNNSPTDIAFNLYTYWIPNDSGDADTGANNQQNYPVILSATVTGNQLTITYLVDTDVANATYPLRIDFYVDVDEGSGAFLVSDSYPATSAGMPRTVILTLPSSAPLTGFVASATDANGYSSEFSPSWVFDRIFADRFEGH